MAEVQTYSMLDAKPHAHGGKADGLERADHRVLELSCTIADLDCAENIQAQHLAEVLQYRPWSVM